LNELDSREESLSDARSPSLLCHILLLALSLSLHISLPLDWSPVLTSKDVFFANPRKALLTLSPYFSSNLSKAAGRAAIGEERERERERVKREEGKIEIYHYE
jgi:hypothetical protein